MENPFVFGNPNKPRLVTNVNADWNKVYGGAGMLWAVSMGCYVRNFFRVNNNAVYLLAFTAFSVPASYGYAKFALSSPEEEAAYMNNQAEGA